MALLASNHSFTPVMSDTTFVKLTDLNGKDKSMILSAPIELVDQGMSRYENSFDLIQDCFPFLTKDEREFIMTGLTVSEWDEMWKEEK